MRPTRESPAGTFVPIAISLGVGALFLVLTIPETQLASIDNASPWREDPYHTVVLLAQFATVVLGAALLARWPARRAPGAADRFQQMTRATGVMIALIVLTVGFEWASVAAGDPRSAWTASTTVQVIGLVALSALSALSLVLLARSRSPRGSSRQWRYDWLGDLAVLVGRVPALRRRSGPDSVATIRRHAFAVLTGASALVGALTAVVQVVGEGVDNPVLVAWYFIAGTACLLAFCLLSNLVAGFIARPPLGRARRITESSVVAGCVAVLAAIAFHDQLWSLFGSGSLTPRSLAALTLGAGIAVALATAALLLRAPRPRSSAPRAGSV